MSRHDVAVKVLGPYPTLEQRLDQGPLPAGEALRVVATVAGAFAAAHRAGVAHGHLVPANIVLGPDGGHVTDFGLVMLHRGSEDGHTVGGLSYLAPELPTAGRPRQPPTRTRSASCSSPAWPASARARRGARRTR